MRTTVGLRWVSAVVLGLGVLLLPSPALAANANLSVTKTDSPDPVAAGSNITYTITVASNGQDPASSPTLTDSTPANTTFVSLSATGGWTCPTAPVVGGTGAVNCSGPTLASGSSVTITLVVNVNAGTPGGTIITNTATASSPDDASASNNSGTATTTVSGGGGADLRITKSDSPDPVSTGGNITYSISASNLGPSGAASLALSDVVPANTTFVSLTFAAGWSCSKPAVGGTGTVSCTIASMASGAGASFTLVVKVNAGTPNTTVITNTATITATSTDPSTANNTATATSTVGTAAELCALAATIKGTNASDTLNGTSGDDIICGGNGSDTINGLGGNDTIFGQNGRDALNGSDGNDNVMGANGKDEVTGGVGTDMLRGGNAPDVLNGQDGAGGDSLDGGNGPDTCLRDTGDTTANCP
jgi:uncharacterized repeat protein (TIGR01451 family)